MEWTKLLKVADGCYTAVKTKKVYCHRHISRNVSKPDTDSFLPTSHTCYIFLLTLVSRTINNSADSLKMFCLCLGMASRISPGLPSTSKLRAWPPSVFLFQANSWVDTSETLYFLVGAALHTTTRVMHEPVFVIVQNSFSWCDFQYDIVAPPSALNQNELLASRLKHPSVTTLTWWSFIVVRHNN